MLGLCSRLGSSCASPCRPVPNILSIDTATLLHREGEEYLMPEEVHHTAEHVDGFRMVLGQVFNYNSFGQAGII